MPLVAGLDGTDPETWITVQLEDGHLVGLQRFETLAEALEVCQEAHVIAVDLAVGHDDPDGTRRGGRRACDLAARERFGQDRPDLPLVPPPSLLDAERLEAAQATAQERGWQAPTQGLWRLREHLAALDEHAEDERVYEVRTELSFHAMQIAQGRDDRALPMPPGRWDGIYARLKLLAEEGLRPARSTGGVGMLSPKDALGATAAAWTAARLQAGEATCLPADPPEDPRTGRPVAIHR